ncbi:putative membrane transport ATPase [Bordetella bronchiseptica MO211]|nr:putative membrane transport ATPase [Bordetella bronchiseptica MO211]
MPSTTRDLALDTPSGPRTDAHGHDHAGHDHAGHDHAHDHGIPACCGHEHGQPAAPAAAPAWQPGPGQQVTRVRIGQMDCPTEETLIRKKLASLPEVHELDFNLMQRVLTVLHADGALDRIDAAIRSLGMTPEPLAGDAPAAPAGAAAYEATGKTAIALADGQRVLLLAAVADTLKASSAAAVADLHRLGVRTLMLTGDNTRAAQAVAAQAGIDEARGDLLPQDKLDAVEAKLDPALRVGMVGDGINDAPALARADIGFAMGAAGTGTAIETADVALMDDDLRKIGTFVRLSRATHRILTQNIVLALGIKAVFLVLAMAGQATLWMAVFADVGASLLVVANGLRLLRAGRHQAS